VVEVLSPGAFEIIPGPDDVLVGIQVSDAIPRYSFRAVGAEVAGLILSAIDR
jgi:hypothetical protein